jgi:nicotinate phosphoribosyltransferase
VRQLLDEHGLTKTQIMASNELDEYLIADLKQQGAKIGVWGVGTHLVTGKGQPALDGVYKLSAIQDAQGKWDYRLKLSNQTIKVTTPGILQVRRFFDGDFYAGDAVYDELLGIKAPYRAIDLQDPNHQLELSSNAEWNDLLVPIFHRGKCVYHSPSLSQMQARTQRELARLPVSMERFTHPEPYFTGLEEGLYRKKLELIRKKR